MHECQLHKSVTLKTIYFDVICLKQKAVVLHNKQSKIEMISNGGS